MYLLKKDYILDGFRKSKTKGKMYDAIIRHRKTDKTRSIPFGSIDYENYQDKTGLDLYPHLIHGNKKRRRNYRARHKGFIKPDFYSPSYFSYNYLW